MFNYKYLSREHLEGFDNYKYMAIDTSPLSVYVMHPFWNKVVELFPRWVAPNVLTFAGFLLTVLDFLLLSYYDYSYFAASAPPHNETADPLASLNGHAEVIPRPLWLALAVFLFLAYTLDGIDGKQARRTQTSGPLGELFDHGLDSYSVFFIPACLYSIFGRLDFSIPPIRMYYVMWNLLLNFYISHWEKYNTGVLFLPWGYDFSMWASTFCFAWTAVSGTSFYKRYAFGSYTLANVFEFVIYATGVFTNLPVSIYNIYKVDYITRYTRLDPALRVIHILRLAIAFACCHERQGRLDSKLRTFVYKEDPLFLASGTSFYKRYTFGSYTLANVFEFVIYATGVFTNLPVFIHNYKSYKLRTGKMRSPGEALRPLWSFLTVFAVCSLWMHYSTGLPDSDLRMVFLLIGTVFSNVACRLIVSQMSNQRCEAVNWLAWPLALAAAVSLAQPRHELTALYAVTALAVAAHIHYGTCVVRQMCDHFRISCFHIKQRSD